MSEQPPDSQGESPEDERKRLELEKLRLDVDAARAAQGLGVEKQRLELEQLKKGDRRSTVSLFAPILLGPATLFVGLSGLLLNSTINRAAEQQHAFDNYNKLTEQFAKGGSAQLGALVGLRPFLKPWSERSEQTVELLVTDLRKETDPITRRAVVYDLVYAGMPAFQRVREANVIARDKLKAAVETGLLYRRAKPGTHEGVYETVFQIAEDLKDAVTQYDPEATQDVLSNRKLVISDVILIDTFDYQDLGTPSNPKPPPWAKDFLAETPVFLATVDVLRGLFKQHKSELKNLDASGIAVYDVDLRDVDLQGINLSHSIVEGRANGADLRMADLSNANIDLDMTRSPKRSTSLCGALLDGTILHIPQVNDLALRDALAHRDALPDLTASDWWKMGGVPGTLEKVIAASFPRRANEKAAAGTPDDKQRACDERHYTQATSTVGATVEGVDHYDAMKLP
jgi:hypothetical protein